MLCLSCIVVFCTIYVLILPAITLEKKTTCEEEQSAIQEEQPLVQEEDESIVQSTIQSDDSEDIEFVSCEPIEEETDDVEEVEITETRKKRWMSILLREKKMPLKRQTKM